MNPRIKALRKEASEWRSKLAELRGEQEALRKAGQEIPQTLKDTEEAFAFKMQSCEDRANSIEQLYAPTGREQPAEGAFTLMDAMGRPVQRQQQAAAVPQGVSAGQAWFYKTFGPPRASSSGFDSVGDFMRAVQVGNDSRLRILAGQMEGSGAGGGFLVPEEHKVSILSPAYEASICLQRCETHPMLHETLTVAGWDTQSASAGTLFGGFTCQIVGEGDDMTPQTGQVRSIKLQARKGAILAKSSNELAADAPALPQMMESGLGTAIGYLLDYWCINGTGVGQPLGAINAPSRITEDKEVGQAAATITARNLADMFSRLHPACYSKAIWMASPSCIPQLEALTVTAGTAGQLWPGLVRQEAGGYGVMGRPCVISEKLKALGTEGDIMLCDWSQYALGLRQDVSVEASRHVYFASDEIAWRAIARFDGMPKWSSTYTDVENNTYSWAVTLQTRS